ncbi:MAG: addiction module antitoxin [Candidatus Schekmanbacteria bacterium RBG_13_48_7]|uniref:Addiction module antitoxin n=1 Tax=Candidatus Schekmanbacteria bacterium RBG_13_48_7 TaxID=1817878 RepID=A0A1F7RR17_9BACT|nr:MAG: addiction module antitoxin [Candidatus Schekmanbacteria bacterium RBG_13_48_7]
MQKKLTITVDEEVYKGLHKSIGRRKISKFIENLVKPHVVNSDLEAAYEKMAKDRERENEAHDWAEAIIGDMDDQG